MQQVQVSAQYTQFEDRAQTYVTTERHVKMEPKLGETVAAFADRACDILLPRDETTADMTPAMFRKNACRFLVSHAGDFFPEDAIMHAVLGSTFRHYFLALKPRPLTGG